MYRLFFDIMDFIELQAKMQEYADKGYADECAKAARYAQIKTRAFVERLHPATAFGGISLRGNNPNGNTPNQVVKGSFKVADVRSSATVFADYFSRWYDTGAFGRIITRGKRKGQKGPIYPSRGSIFEKNRQAIEDYFAKQVEEYFKEVGLWQKQK